MQIEVKRDAAVAERRKRAKATRARNTMAATRMACATDMLLKRARYLLFGVGLARQ